MERRGRKKTKMESENEQSTTIENPNDSTHPDAAVGIATVTTPSARKRSRVRGPWSVEEDAILTELVTKIGAENWSLIARGIPCRSARSCRRRWCNMQEEDHIIISSHAIHGNKCAAIANLVPGLNNASKNHWSSTRRRRYDLGKLTGDASMNRKKAHEGRQDVNARVNQCHQSAYQAPISGCRLDVNVVAEQSQLSGQEDVLECSAMENRKEDCVLNNLSNQQASANEERRDERDEPHRKIHSKMASATLKVSPCFEELSVNEEEERDELHRKKRSKTASATPKVSPYFQKLLVNEERQDEKVELNRKIRSKTASATRNVSPYFQKPKRDGIHRKIRSKTVSATRKVSPYFQLERDDFQKLYANEEKQDERDELCLKTCSKTSTDKAALKAFAQLLSKYAYKSDTMNGAGDNVDKDGPNDEVGEELERKKQRRGSANTTLTRAQKFSEAYRRKTPNNTWKPPRSPYNLLQEDHVHDPWRVLVICMLLNVTTGDQVRKVLSLFFRLCPNAEAALKTKAIEIASVIESLGLHRKRAAMIQRFSEKYISDDWTHVTQLPGIGKYAADAYAIFCNGLWDQVTPNDYMLNYYWKFLRNRAP